MIEKDILTRFAQLFRGSNFAHGTFNKFNSNMATIPQAPTKEDFIKHLDGELGIGIIPVNEEGKCWFACIDVDIDTINHADLYKKVKARNLPLSVCRSKSGGAHLYVFFKEAHPSAATQTLLKKWAGLLGFPNNTEIFPKQTRSLVATPGNWLNMPYFNSENTLRYAMGDNGSLTIEEFLNSVTYYTGKENIDDAVTSDLVQINQMPPCLKELTDEGLPSGMRNVGLFNYGVFYRKSSPNGWQDKLRYHNQNYVSPPLQSREIEALLKSLEGRQYQYKCSEEPICSRCDRATCLTLPYGIGNKSWEDDNNFDEIVVGNLRKILTDPPTYILEVNGKDLHLESDQFRKFDQLRKRVFEVHDAVIRPIKQQQWDQKLRELLASKVEIHAPDDASAFGALNSKIDDFLCLSDRSKGRQDLMRGMPILEGDNIMFQVGFLQKYLMSQKVMIDNQDLFSTLHRRQCTSELIRIKGKVIRAWSIPAKLINRQEDDYDEAKFETIDEGEI